MIHTAGEWTVWWNECKAENGKPYRAAGGDFPNLPARRVDPGSGESDRD
ncbi:MAG: hypothetical protein ABFD54_16555 [Armatimonadota bacterium]